MTPGGIQGPSPLSNFGYIPSDEEKVDLDNPNIAQLKKPAATESTPKPQITEETKTQILNGVVQEATDSDTIVSTQAAPLVFETLANALLEAIKK